ncbi:MAG: ribonuclease HII [Oligoflexia bacterium]|nr:ribonuclease HII [Oligoflexia bacterium]
MLANHLTSKKNKSFIIAGVDEVGRGPLAGPVVAATVSLKISSLTIATDDHQCNLNKIFTKMMELGVTDSKKLTANKRASILKEIGIDINVDIDIDSNSLYDIPLLSYPDVKMHFSISEASVQEIDNINILRASILAMNRSFHPHIDKNIEDILLLIDGNNKINASANVNLTEIPIIKGDQKSLLIALASILAKEYRDNLMVKLSKKHPLYGFEKHAGYPTKKHKQIIQELGPTPYHRKTFIGVKEFIREF